MGVTSGTVRAGKVILHRNAPTDGTEVVVVSRERSDDSPVSPEELAELEAGLAEADRGETIPGDELFARLIGTRKPWPSHGTSRVRPL